ncbi:NAD(+)/NADH kinase [Dictyobacter arantiisoli]|uniref:NAD kinase n=1 Tax=Dictyobacter arantiisoli TaxID=2014874 RepID=A0A5A5T912_9CHLR|nr:NAD(+)/NADH kinase [Dictyobacter arantiisoli]GCF07666.1 NAD kinase [Dictyobacter arantiisoli]
MKTIAIFYQGRKQDSSRFAAQLVPTLEQQGHTVRAIDIHQEGLDSFVSNEHVSFLGCDVVLVLGGDGTIVHAARMCAATNIPIVGVNFGRVGFLTELEPADIATDLDYYLNGDASVWVDERTMLHAVLEQDGKSEEFLALNDIVIARGTWPRVVQVGVWVDDYYYNTSYADGMIISTATGSTAYNMAVGGPLLHPQVESTVLTPIATHLASDRSLIIQPDATIKLQIFTGSQNGVFSADGQLNREVKDGAIITVHKSKYVTRFLRRRPPTYFYQIINAKLRNDNPAANEINHANRVND